MDDTMTYWENFVFTDAEILANRKTAIEYLKNPKLKKAKERLRNNHGGRCCLGHMCDALGMVAVKDNGDWLYGIGDYADEFALPDEIQAKLGMFTSSGHIQEDTFNIINGIKGSIKYGNREFGSLAQLNDETTIRPQRIAEILEPMILGGYGTPFREITISGKD